MKSILNIFFLLLVLNVQAQIRYVNQNATGANNGISWDNAWTDLQTALQNTTSGDIWVAEGTYTATSGTNREVSLEIEPNVNLFGGFPDTGSPTWNQRDWNAFQTILSGDIGVENDTSDNTYQIMSLVSWSPFDNTIDGFLFTDGNSDYEAGAIDISGLFDFDSKVTIRNCTFRGNYADYEGAAISSSWTDVLIDNCIFEDNYAGYEGGAISYFSDHFSTNKVSLVCKNSIFRNNFADYEGGAASTRGNNYWYNCLFQGNYATQEGGAMSHFRDGVVDVVNCTFTENTTLGSGSVLEIFSWEDTVIVAATFSNCIFNDNVGNSMIDKGGAVDNVSLQFSFLESCPPDVDCGDGNIFSNYPGFVANDDYRLTSSSPCINVGENDYLPENITTDLAGNGRIYDGQVDLGAYEFEGVVATSEGKITEMSIFPNPAYHSLFVQSNNPISTLVLSNSQGQSIRRWELQNENRTTLNIADVPPGLYLLSVKNKVGIYTQKVIIQ